MTYLEKNREASRTDIRNNVRAAIKTIYSALPILMKLGLIEEQTSRKFPFAVTISLTDRRRRVGEHLTGIEKILAE